MSLPPVQVLEVTVRKDKSDRKDEPQLESSVADRWSNMTIVEGVDGRSAGDDWL